MTGRGGGRIEREASAVSTGRLRVQVPPFSFAQPKDVHVIQTPAICAPVCLRCCITDSIHTSNTDSDFLNMYLGVAFVC